MNIYKVKALLIILLFFCTFKTTTTKAGEYLELTYNKEDLSLSAVTTGELSAEHIKIIGTNELSFKDCQYILHYFLNCKVLDLSEFKFEDNTIKYDQENNVGAFMDNNRSYKLEKIIFPEKEGNKVITIGKRSFYGLKTLKEVWAPSVQTVGEFAFTNCGNLEKVSFPAAKTISHRVFEKCKALKIIDINSVTRVEDLVFNSAENLETVKMPYVNFIGDEAFKSCPNLKTLVLPKNLPENFENIGLTTQKIIYLSSGTTANYNFTNSKSIKYSSLPERLSLTSSMALEVGFIEENNFVDNWKIYFNDNIIKSGTGRVLTSLENNETGIYVLEAFNNFETDYVIKIPFSVEAEKLEQTITLPEELTLNIADAAKNITVETNAKLENPAMTTEVENATIVELTKLNANTLELKPKAPGVTNITITSGETENYKKASKKIKITVTETLVKGKSEQILTLPDEITLNIADIAKSITVETNVKLENPTITTEVENTTILELTKLNANILELKAKTPGTTNITITSGETENYKKASKKIKITVTEALVKGKSEQTLTLPDEIILNIADSAKSITIETNAKLENPAITTEVENATIVELTKLNANTLELKPKAPGVTNITITSEETENYKKASKKIKITVTEALVKGKSEQTLTLPDEIILNIADSAKSITVGTNARLENPIINVGIENKEKIDAFIINADALELRPKSVGTTNIIIYVSETENYKSVQKIIKIKVENANTNNYAISYENSETSEIVLEKTISKPLEKDLYIIINNVKIPYEIDKENNLIILFNKNLFENVIKNNPKEVNINIEEKESIAGLKFKLESTWAEEIPSVIVKTNLGELFATRSLINNIKINNIDSMEFILKENYFDIKLKKQDLDVIWIDYKNPLLIGIPYKDKVENLALMYRKETNNILSRSFVQNEKVFAKVYKGGEFEILQKEAQTSKHEDFISKRNYNYLNSRNILEIEEISLHNIIKVLEKTLDMEGFKDSLIPENKNLVTIVDMQKIFFEIRKEFNLSYSPEFAYELTALHNSKDFLTTKLNS